MNVSKRYNESVKNVEKTINSNGGLVDDDQSIVLGLQSILDLQTSTYEKIFLIFESKNLQYRSIYTKRID